MPNINLQEKDMSTFADQQFISIAYNGKTNEVSGNAKVLAYRVTFVSDNTNYCIVEVGENQKVNIPTPPTKEGYTFKQWLLNGEAFDFSTVITSDITLIAEFEEAGEEVIYEKTLTFAVVEEGSVATDSETSIAELLAEGNHYTLVVGNETYPCICISDSGDLIIINSDYPAGGLKWFVGDSVDGMQVSIVNGTFEGDRLVKIVKAEAPVEDVVWEDTLEFVSVEEEMPGWLMFNGEEAFPELDKLNTTDTFTFSIPELNKSVTGKFTKVSEEDNAYILGEEEDGINLQANTSFYVVAVEGDVEGTYTVKLTKSEAPAPSETVLVPVDNYTTLPESGAYLLRIGDLSEGEDYVNALYEAFESGNMDKIKHTIVVGDETLTEQTLNESDGTLWFGNAVLVGLDTEDTGENWCAQLVLMGDDPLVIGLATREATTIKFGISYTVEA